MTFTHRFVTAPQLTSTTAADGKRVYTKPDGTEYTSVTTFLSELPSPGLDAWRKRVGNKEADKISGRATHRGNIIHGYIEDYLMNKPAKPRGLVTKKLFNQVKPELNKLNNIRLIEQGIYSDKLMLAGRPDVIAEYNGKLAIVDFKGSEKTKDNLNWINNYFCQVGAYAIMYHELFNEPVEITVVLIAVEDANVPQVVITPVSECVTKLRDYAKQLILHRKKIEEAKTTA